MLQPIRPVRSFVLRLWREPGAAEGEIGWRGLLRALEGSEAPVREFPFHGLAGLLAAVQEALGSKETKSSVDV
jgi:hypothetical protein